MPVHEGSSLWTDGEAWQQRATVPAVNGTNSKRVPRISTGGCSASAGNVLGRQRQRHGRQPAGHSEQYPAAERKPGRQTAKVTTHHKKGHQRWNKEKFFTGSQKKKWCYCWMRGMWFWAETITALRFFYLFKSIWQPYTILSALHVAPTCPFIIIIIRLYRTEQELFKLELSNFVFSVLFFWFVLFLLLSWSSWVSIYISFKKKDLHRRSM